MCCVVNIEDFTLPSCGHYNKSSVFKMNLINNTINRPKSLITLDLFPGVSISNTVLEIMKKIKPSSLLRTGSLLRLQWIL